MRLLMLAALVAVVAAVAAAAYAAWSQQLQLHSRVSTTELDAEFTSVLVLDACSNNDDYNVKVDNNGLPDFNYIYTIGANYSCMEAKMLDTDGDGDYDTIEVTIYNAYPRYYSDLQANIVNNGNLPENLLRLVIESADGSVKYGTIYESNATLISNGHGYLVDLNGDGVADIALDWQDSIGSLLDVGNRLRFTFGVAVLDGAPEGATLQFRLRLEMVQWNAYNPPSSGG